VATKWLDWQPTQASGEGPRRGAKVPEVKWLGWQPTQVSGGCVRTDTSQVSNVPFGGDRVPKVTKLGFEGGLEVPKVTKLPSFVTFGTCHFPPGTEKTELPWPGYNGGNQFVCGKCGAHFDTGTGHAKHEVYGCDWQPPTTTPATGTLPSCPACGSYAVYREKDGTLTCQTCGVPHA
jgi:ribosomal protein L37AE/L43A